jgi:hypothetical protein
MTKLGFMRKLVIGSAIAAALAASPALAADKPDACVIQTEVATRQPISRSELLINQLPLGSDIYFVDERSGGNEFSNLRLQAFPARYKSVRIGVATQHIDCSGAEPRNDLGIALSASKSAEKSFAKADLRYFPSQDRAETYGLWTGGKIFIDMLGSYNTATGATALRPGIDYKLGSCRTGSGSVIESIGVEAKFSGGFPKLGTDYAGVRGKLSFSF